MPKLMFVFIALLGACADVPLDLGPIDEDFTCQIQVTCNHDVRVDRFRFCAKHGTTDKLLKGVIADCEAELADRGCLPEDSGCGGGWCEGTGVTEGDGVFRACLAEDPE